MAPLPWPAGQTPYVTPDQLYNVQGTLVASQWPVGVQWGTFPGVSGTITASAVQAFSVLAMVCQQATTDAEIITHQPLRAVVATEELSGPHYRLTVQADELNGRFLCSRGPITQVLSVQVCPNTSWPRQWTSLPAGTFEPEVPVPGLYGSNTPSGAGEGGQSILFAPGWIDWSQGRNYWRVRAQYVHGWPHTCFTAAGTVGQTLIPVDDCTGWGPAVTASGGTIGATGLIYDALGGGQEPITCTAATAVAGPGTLTLSAPLSFAHAAGIMVSALPQNAIWGTALLAGQAALARGATATTVQTTSGHRQVTGTSLRDQAKLALHAYRTTV